MRVPSPRPRPAAVLGRALLAGLAAVAAPTLHGCARPDDEARDERPHVVIVSIDTLRADHLGCYGYERPTSPHIDAFARDAVLYENAHSHSNSTAPSHVTLLSGVLPPVHGVRHRVARGPSPAVPMLAEQFAQAGWTTAAFADGGYVTGPFGLARGFGLFDSRLERFDAKLDRVERWLAGAEERPTLLFVHTYGVHAPYLPAEEHDRFTDQDYDGPLAGRVAALQARLSEDGRWPPFEQTQDVFWGDRGALDTRDRQHLVDLYDGCLHEVDAGIGRLLGLLRSRGWLDDAWVVLTSDHGEAFGEHGTLGHRQLHEPELHVPLIVRPPGGVPGGVRVRDAVGLSAVAPTLLRAAGLPVPEAVQGRALEPLGSPGDRPVHATAADAEEFVAVIDGGRKLVVHGARDVRELYDLRVDPGERHDLLAEDGADPDDDGGAAEAAAEAAAATRSALEAVLDGIAAACRDLRARLGEPVEGEGLDPTQEQALRALGYVR